MLICIIRRVDRLHSVTKKATTVTTRLQPNISLVNSIFKTTSIFTNLFPKAQIYQIPELVWKMGKMKKRLGVQIHKQIFWSPISTGSVQIQTKKFFFIWAVWFLFSCLESTRPWNKAKTFISTKRIEIESYLSYWLQIAKDNSGKALKFTISICTMLQLQTSDHLSVEFDKFSEPLTDFISYFCQN